VAAKDIPIDAILTADMLTTKRPGTGIPASALLELVGRSACAPIKNDTTVTWDMVR
jgi:sialic acid synthase SpsE